MLLRLSLGGARVGLASLVTGGSLRLSLQPLGGYCLNSSARCFVGVSLGPVDKGLLLARPLLAQTVNLLLGCRALRALLCGIRSLQGSHFLVTPSPLLHRALCILLAPGSDGGDTLRHGTPNFAPAELSGQD